MPFLSATFHSILLSRKWHGEALAYRDREEQAQSEEIQGISEGAEEGTTMEAGWRGYAAVAMSICLSMTEGHLQTVTKTVCEGRWQTHPADRLWDT